MATKERLAKVEQALEAVKQALTTKTVRAERIELVGEKGRIFAILGMTVKDEPALSLYDATGETRAVLDIRGGDAVLTLCGASGMRMDMTAEGGELSPRDPAKMRLDVSEGGTTVVPRDGDQPQTGLDAEAGRAMRKAARNVRREQVQRTKESFEALREALQERGVEVGEFCNLHAHECGGWRRESPPCPGWTHWAVGGGCWRGGLPCANWMRWAVERVAEKAAEATGRIQF